MPPSKAKHAEYMKAWRLRNRDELRKKDRERYLKDPKGRVASRRLKKTGWSEDDVRRALAQQNGRCAICEIALTEGRGSTGMTADHDHETGRKRALLCNRCNILEGSHLEVPLDEEEWGRRIKKYRAQFRSES